jgi:hypothetical protein
MKTLKTDCGTWFLGKKKVRLVIYDKCKYDPSSKEIKEVKYEIEGFGVYNSVDFDPDEFKQIVNQGMMDDYDEYLKLWFGDDESATFRNSYVDLFLF